MPALVMARSPRLLARHLAFSHLRIAQPRPRPGAIDWWDKSDACPTCIGLPEEKRARKQPPHPPRKKSPSQPPPLTATAFTQLTQCVAAFCDSFAPQVVAQTLAAGLVTVAISSEDRDGSRCWNPSGAQNPALYSH